MATGQEISEPTVETRFVIRHHYYKLHSLLTEFPTTLEELTIRYYSVHYIDGYVKSIIMANSSRPQDAARILLDYLELKVAENPEHLTNILAIMKKQRIMRDIVQKMESSQKRCRDGGVAQAEKLSITDIPANTVSGPPFLSSAVDEVATRAAKLSESFESLTLNIMTCPEMKKIDTSVVKLKIHFFFQSHGVSKSPEICSMFFDLEAVQTADGLIRFMVSRNLIGYLNFTLLKHVFQGPFLLDQTTLGIIDAYERQHEQFIRSNLNTLLAVFKSRPDLAPVSVVGLPKIKVTLNESWKGRSLYQWNELMADIGMLPDHLMITDMKMNCVTITYAVLPCFVSTITNILSDVKVTKALFNVGVTFTIDEEILKMGSLDTKYHELLIRNAISMIGHSSTSLVQDQQQHVTLPGTREIKYKSVAQPPPTPIEGGYDDEMFLSPPPMDFQCIVCQSTVRDPQLILCCGAIVCKICMSLSNASSICPKCRHKNSNIVPDKRTKGQTMDLKVKCIKGDCTWTGELVDYHNHMKKCPYRIVECQYVCGQYFMASDIAIHEEVECTKRPYNVITSHQERLLEAVEKKHSSQISDLETRITEMENEKATAQVNIMKLEEEKATLESKMTQLKAGLEAHVETLKTESGHLKAQLVHRETQLKSTESKLYDARNNLNQLEKEKNRQLLELQSENDRHKSQQAEYKKDREKYAHLDSLQKENKSQEQQLEELKKKLESKHTKYKKLKEKLLQENEELKLRMARNLTTFFYIASILVLGLAVLPYITYIYGTRHMETMHRQEITRMETERNATLAQLKEIQNEKKIMEQTHSIQISKLKEETIKRQMEVTILETQSKEAFKQLKESQLETGSERMKNFDLRKKNYHLMQTAYAYGFMERAAFPNWYDVIKLSDGPPCVRAMADYTKHRRNKESWYSSPFYTKVGGYKLQLRVDTDGDHIGVGLHLMRGDNDDELKWPFSGSITVRLLNWREDKDHIDHTFTVIPSTTDPNQSPFGNRVINDDQAPDHLIMYKNDFISHKQLLAEGNIQYLMDDVMSFIITQVNNISGYDTSVFPVWCHQQLSYQYYGVLPVYRTIQDFNQHKENNDVIYTDPFYTSNGGYKVTLAVHPNGYGAGKGTHVSVFVHLMKGPNDDNLQFPITGIFTVQMLNWQGNNHHIVWSIVFDDNTRVKCRKKVTTGERANGCGKYNFLSHDIMKKYLDEDMMSFKISFDPIIQTGQPIPSWIPEVQSTSATPPCTRTMYSYSVYKKTDTQWYSQPFYSSDKGYKLQLRVDANGYGSSKGTHLSLYVYLMKGEYDNTSSWPFNAFIIVQLLNWSSDNHHEEIIIGYYKAAVEYRQKVAKGTRAPGGWGYGQFISHTKLQGSKFIAYDKICFRIIINDKNRSSIKLKNN